jgi:hypothetical protein
MAADAAALAPLAVRHVGLRLGGNTAEECVAWITADAEVIVKKPAARTIRAAGRPVEMPRQGCKAPLITSPWEVTLKSHLAFALSDATTPFPPDIW